VTLEDVLEARRPLILRRWCDAILALYPPEARRFLDEEPDRFRNPIGAILRETVEDLYDRLCRPPACASCSPLDRFMRLLAVQGIDASQAANFILALKPLVRAELLAWGQGPRLGSELSELDDRIEALVGLAIDLFVAGRQQIVELRAREVQRRTAKLLERLQAGSGQG
jgi:hypothetical protein